MSKNMLYRKTRYKARKMAINRKSPTAFAVGLFCIVGIELHGPKINFHPNCEVRIKPYPSNWGVLYLAIRFVKIAAHDTEGFPVGLPEIGFYGDLAVKIQSAAFGIGANLQLQIQDLLTSGCL